MFDLHLHTNLSDGELSVEELLEMLDKLGISTFSITDHNHALSYEYINREKHPHLITGTELATSYKGVIVEVLGYHVNPEIINTWFHNFYSSENLIKNENELWNRLVAISKTKEIYLEKYSLPNTIVKGCSKKTAFKILSENTDFEFKTFKEFFRQGLSNPGSDWYIAEDNLYPSLKETIDLIHSAKGVAILAHPYEYGFKDLEPLLQKCINEGIDGIECFHPSSSMYNSVAMVNFVNENNLLGSGGSDYHRASKKVKPGVYANEDLLNTKCFQWIKGE